MRKIFISFFVFLFMMSPQAILFAQDNGKANPDPLRFKNEVNAFITYDKKNSYPQKAVLFFGSSSIRKWHTHESFPQFPVINRGFGGSQLSDALYYYEVLVKKYHPSVVVFYEGDNDIAFGKSPQQVFDDYKTFVKRFLHDFPASRLIFISIKPSILRWKIWPQMQEVNRLIENYNAERPRLFYLDLADTLLGEDGKPQAELFEKDGLHLNDKGYARWNARLLPVLRKLFRQTQH